MNIQEINAQRIISGLHEWASGDSSREAAVVLFTESGLMDAFIRVSPYSQDDEQPIGISGDHFWLNSLAILRGDSSFSTTEKNFSMLVASLLGEAVPLDLGYILGRCDLGNQLLIQRVIRVALRFEEVSFQ